MNNSEYKVVSFSVGGFNLTYTFIKDLEIREEFFSFIPSLFARFRFPEVYNGKMNLTKGTKFTIKLTPHDTDSDSDGEVDQSVSLNFSVMDFEIMHNPRASEAEVTLFAIHEKCNNLFLNGTRHRITQGNTSKVITDTLQSSGYKVESSASTTDSMNWIQLNETDLRFVKRLIKHSYMGGRDFLVSYADRFGIASVTSINSLTNGRDSIIRFDATSTDIDKINDKDLKNGLDGLNPTSANMSIPCSLMFKRDHHGSITLFGGSGSLIKGFSNFTSSFRTENIGLDVYDNDSMGKFMPVKDSDFGKPNSSRFVPWADNGIVFKEYHKAIDLNSQFWNLMFLNSIEFTCKYYDHIKLGSAFQVDIDDRSNENVTNKRSTYLTDKTFVISSLVHTFDSEQGRLWTKVFGSSFGLDIHENMPEGKFNYVRL